ncbi:uncharacterized protein LOC134302011 [Trichomycterus rosablanca]|uniref:uncharacterized protein LOC134302011 n=1 Tax=Trichomycterus rosablanca TaxID=2290929 RepID=UPI002F3608A3
MVYDPENVVVNDPETLNTHFRAGQGKIQNFSAFSASSSESSSVTSQLGEVRMRGDRTKKSAEIKEDFLIPDCKNEDYLEEISQIVSKHRGSKLRLGKVEKFTFRVGSFNDTWYKDEPDILEEWEQFYLPDHMFMEVIGVLENFYNETSRELVLMVCEDGKVYAYEDEYLHLVAKSLKDLFDCKVQFPGIKQYYSGQAFEDMTDEEWDKVKNSKEVTQANKEKQQMLKVLLNNLTIVTQGLQKEQPGSSCVPVKKDPVKPPQRKNKKSCKSAARNCSHAILGKRKMTCSSC